MPASTNLRKGVVAGHGTIPKKAPRKPRTIKKSSRRKIAIIGFTSSLQDAPWGDPEWEIWPLNNLHRVVPEEIWKSATAWFDLHDWNTIKADEHHLAWLKAGHMPVYLMPEVVGKDEFPTVQPFPRDMLLDAFDALSGRRYYTNSVSYLIAYAILKLQEGGDGGEIGLWGIDMAQGGEYASQRPSCEYWLGLAEGAGITVTIAEKADLLKCAFLYGVDEGGAFVTKMRARTAELETRLELTNNEVGDMLSKLEMKRYEQNQIVGALESQRYIEGVWFQPEGTRKGGADPYSTEAVEPQAAG